MKTPYQIIDMAAKGDSNAYEFGEAWMQFCHSIDDVYDGDAGRRPNNSIPEACMKWTLAVAANPFFLQHKPMLMALIVQSVNAWMDSNQREGTERHVLAGMYHEVIFHIAFLTGGWEHLRHVTAECREYKAAKETV